MTTEIKLADLNFKQKSRQTQAQQQTEATIIEPKNRWLALTGNEKLKKAFLYLLVLVLFVGFVTMTVFVILGKEENDKILSNHEQQIRKLQKLQNTEYESESIKNISIVDFLTYYSNRMSLNNKCEEIVNFDLYKSLKLQNGTLINTFKGVLKSPTHILTDSVFILSLLDNYFNNETNILIKKLNDFVFVRNFFPNPILNVTLLQNKSAAIIYVNETKLGRDVNLNCLLDKNYYELEIQLERESLLENIKHSYPTFVLISSMLPKNNTVVELINKALDGKVEAAKKNSMLKIVAINRELNETNKTESNLNNRTINELNILKQVLNADKIDLSSLHFSQRFEFFNIINSIIKLLSDYKIRIIEPVLNQTDIEPK